MSNRLHSTLWLLLVLLLTACQSTQTVGMTSFRTLQTTPAPREALFQEPAAAPFVQKTRQGLLLAYQGLDGDSRQIFVRRSANGQQWETPVQVSQNSLSVTRPQITEDTQGHLKLFYHSNESEAWQLYVSESSDARQWSPPRRVNLPEAQISDSVVLYAQKEYILCYQAFGGGLFLTRSADARNWSPPVAISDSGEAPSLSRDARGNWAVSYEGPTDSGWTVYVSSSADLTRWSAPQALGTDSRSRWGRLVSGSKATVLVFASQAAEGGWELFKRSSSDLKSWSAPTALTVNGLRNVNPQLSPASASSAYLAWEIAPLASRVSHLSLQQLKF